MHDNRSRITRAFQNIVTAVAAFTIIALIVSVRIALQSGSDKGFLSFDFLQKTFITILDKGLFGILLALVGYYVSLQIETLKSTLSMSVEQFKSRWSVLYDFSKTRITKVSDVLEAAYDWESSVILTYSSIVRKWEGSQSDDRDTLAEILQRDFQDALADISTRGDKFRSLVMRNRYYLREKLYAKIGVDYYNYVWDSFNVIYTYRKGLPDIEARLDLVHPDSLNVVQEILDDWLREGSTRTAGSESRPRSMFSADKHLQERVVRSPSATIDEQISAEPAQRRDIVDTPDRTLGPALSRQTHVISIGVSQYEYLASIPSAGSDAMLFADTLRTQCAVPASQITLLVDAKATKSTVIEAFDRVCRALDRNSTLVVYVSSHGWKTEDQFFLVMRDTAPDRLVETAISASLLESLLARCVARGIFVILDSSFAGAFASSSPGFFRVTGDGGFRILLAASDALGQADAMSPFARSLVRIIRGDVKVSELPRLIYFNDLFHALQRQLAEESPAQIAVAVVAAHGDPLVFARAG